MLLSLVPMLKSWQPERVVLLLHISNAPLDLMLSLDLLSILMLIIMILSKFQRLTLFVNKFQKLTLFLSKFQRLTLFLSKFQRLTLLQGHMSTFRPVD